MNPGQGPRRGRRHSLPAIHTTLGFSRAVPEGSDTFQQALEDLYNQEPSNAPSTSVCEATLNRLCKIQEGDEDESEQDEKPDPIEQVKRRNRRFSSPAVINQDQIDALRKRAQKVDGKETGKDMKKLTSANKEYFIKHGHWPNKHVVNLKQGSTLPNAAQSGVALGSHASKQTKIKAG